MMFILFAAYKLYDTSRLSSNRKTRTLFKNIRNSFDITHWENRFFR